MARPGPIELGTTNRERGIEHHTRTGSKQTDKLEIGL